MDIQIEDFEGSRIIRLPGNALKGCKSGDVVHLDILKGALLVKPENHEFRSDWAGKIKHSGRKGMESLLIEEPSAIEMDDWEW